MEWIQKIETNSWRGKTIVDSRGNIYVTETVWKENYYGFKQQGQHDVILLKFNNKGEQEWARQLATPASEFASGIALDSKENVVVLWENLGRSGVFFAKYSPDGTQQWIRELNLFASASGIYFDKKDNIVIVGYTMQDLDDGKNTGYYDFFVLKFDQQGRRIWSSLYGTDNNDMAADVVVDDTGNIYVVGSTFGSFNGRDRGIFVTKYDPEGNRMWLKQFSGLNTVFSAAIDSKSNIVIVGITNDGERVIGFALKVNDEGQELWRKLLRSPSTAWPCNIVIDLSDTIYITGHGLDNIFKSYQGIFIIRFRDDGNKEWIEYTGTPLQDLHPDISIDSNGNIYVLHQTYGHIYEESYSNAFLLKFRQEE